MKTETITRKMINEQILFYCSTEAIFTGNIVQETEKAVKVDYTIDSIWMNCKPVFTYSAWFPKSVIVKDENGLTVKNWFVRNFKGGHSIKRYFLSNGKKVFV